MNAENVAILIILVLGVGLIGSLAMPMFDKIPRSDDPQTNETVQKITVPLIDVTGGITATDIALMIAAIIGAIVLVYSVVYKR